MNRFVKYVIASVGVISATSLFAGSPDATDSKSLPVLEKQGSAAPDDVEFRIGIPGWITGLTGDFGVRGVVADMDIGFGDIFNSLDMMVAGSIYARYHRWEFSADGLYLKVSGSAQLSGLLFGDARVSLKDAFSEQF